MAQSQDMESVAHQLRLLEEVVQELEARLEDARRGEAEVTGEVEFLRGEVERVGAEFRGNGSTTRSLSGSEVVSGEAEENEDFDKEISHEEEKAFEREVNGEPHTPPAAASVDADKRCALCEGDGHDSISCLFEK
ncbi:hypothetical protein MMC19_006486 [Ptychographa xylographoides]|nr:hypothetical protein [Ptychographa xylographoides]